MSFLHPETCTQLFSKTPWILLGENRFGNTGWVFRIYMRNGRYKRYSRCWDNFFLTGGTFLWVHTDFSTLSLDMFFSAAHLKNPPANYNCITCLSLSLLGGQHVIHVIDKILNNKAFYGASLVVQWSRCCLPTQGMQIQSLVGEVSSHMLWGSAKNFLKEELHIF